eukprot:scaffold199977_cov37-Tisochrysis_lutea.AAC.2
MNTCMRAPQCRGECGPCLWRWAEGRPSYLGERKRERVDPTRSANRNVAAVIAALHWHAPQGSSATEADSILTPTQLERSLIRALRQPNRHLVRAPADRRKGGRRSTRIRRALHSASPSPTLLIETRTLMSVVRRRVYLNVCPAAPAPCSGLHVALRPSPQAPKCSNVPMWGSPPCHTQ